MVAHVIATYHTCRAWAAPGQDITPSITLAIKQNEQVEADILFYKRHMIRHMIDRADRFHVGTELLTKITKDLLEACQVAWYQILGPIMYLITDGESGLNCNEAKNSGQGWGRLCACAHPASMPE